MSYVEKILIQGFRSFGPNDEDKAVMDFSEKDPDGDRDTQRKGKSYPTVAWPLTLILGQNGCGKTTIIECLRYAATGDCPPGAKQSFVHDPKMASSDRCTGIVKLLIRGVNGHQYTVHRAMQALQKNKAVQMKTMDSTVVDRTADTSTSSKCMDINAHVLDILGVSKPILNYVIFCHQEHSNWPLEEASAVKKKFDEIFQSDKYQDCLKRLKDVRKSHMEKLKLDAIKKDHNLEMRNLARQLKEDLENFENKSELLTAKIEAAKDEVKPLKEKYGRLQALNKDHTRLANEKGRLEASLEAMEEQIRKIRTDGSLPYEYPKSTTEDKMQEDFIKVEDEMGKIERKEEDKKKFVRDTRAKLDLLEKDIKIQAAHLGEATGAMKKHKENSKEFDQLVEETATELGWKDDEIDSMDSSVAESEEATDRVLAKVTKSVKAAEGKLKGVAAEMDKRIDDQNKVISDVDTKRALVDHKKADCRKEMVESQKKIAGIKQQFKKNEKAGEKLEELREKSKRKKEQLDQIKSGTDLQALKDEVSGMKKEKSKLERRRGELREEKVTLDAFQLVRSDMNLKQTDLDEKVRERDRLMAKRRRQLTDVLGSVPDVNRLREAYDKAEARCMEEKASVDKKLNDNANEKSMKREKRRTLQKEVAEKRLVVKKFEDKLAEMVTEEDADLEDELETTTRDLDRARLDAQVKEANKFTYEENIRRMESFDKGKSACPTCNRDFKTEREAEELKADLKEQIQNMPEKVKSIKAKVKRLEERQVLLRTLLPEKRQADDYRTAAEEKSVAVKKLDREVKELDKEVATLEEEKDKCAELVSTCKELHQDVYTVDMQRKAIAVLEDKLQDLKSKNSNMEDVRPMEEFTTEQDDVNDKISELVEGIEEKQSKEIKVGRDVIRLEKEVNEMETERLKIERQQQEAAELEKQRAELEIIVEQRRKDQKELETELEAVREELDEVKKKKNKLAMEKEQLCNKERLDVQAVQKRQHELTSLAGQIRLYDESDNEAKHRNLTRKVKELTTKKANDQELIKTGEEEMEKLQKELKKKIEYRDTIKKNQDLRGYEKEAKGFSDKIKGVEEEMKQGKLGELETKMNNLSAQVHQIEAEMNREQGTLAEVKMSIKRTKVELEKDIHKNAVIKYRKACIQHRVRQHAIKDLNKYYIAMDWSITRYHEERMEVINKRVRELWKMTYKGNDIDYVAIKTDDSGSLAGGADKRRMYNYRVVMYRNEVELDMRGRCSAGQKVLASLIIRMALAETFSSQCGIIALDEPTTNLDRENIESLASALVEFADAAGRGREGRKKNFQLICITHDVDFIHTLGTKAEEQNYYYKVSRNNKGLSTIRKHHIDQIHQEVADVEDED